MRSPRVIRGNYGLCYLTCCTVHSIWGFPTWSTFHLILGLSLLTGNNNIWGVGTLGARGVSEVIMGVEESLVWIGRFLTTVRVVDGILWEGRSLLAQDPRSWNALFISWINYNFSKPDAKDMEILMTSDLGGLESLAKALYLWQGIGEISWWEEGLGQMCWVWGQEWGKLLLMLGWCWEYIWDTHLVASLHFLHFWFLYGENYIIPIETETGKTSFYCIQTIYTSYILTSSILPIL